jgi:integrase
MNGATMPHTTPSTKRKRWSYSAGEWGRNRVRVYERPERGDLFLQYAETQADGELRQVRVSLGRCSQKDAKIKADEIAAKFATLETTTTEAKPATLQSLFDSYEREVTPGKERGTQRHDRVALDLFLHCFGADRDPLSLSRRDWDSFIRQRRRGTLRPKKRAAGVVGGRQIQYDLKTLLAVLNWATTVNNDRGQPLVVRNPLKGMPMPSADSPRRPRLTDDEYRAMLAKASEVHPLFWLALVLAHETGHRIGSILLLRWSDVSLDRRTIRWRADNDKIGFEHETLLTADAAAALEAEQRRQGAIGAAWVLPSPDDLSHHVYRRTMYDWWALCEVLAELTPVERRGFHSLRRQFATEMKHAPLKDLCYLGGWKSAATVINVYQQPDAETMQAALNARRTVSR